MFGCCDNNMTADSSNSEVKDGFKQNSVQRVHQTRQQGLSQRQKNRAEFPPGPEERGRVCVLTADSISP